MAQHYFWKLDPDLLWSYKLELAKIAYSKQKEVPRATGPDPAWIRIFMKLDPDPHYRDKQEVT